MIACCNARALTAIFDYQLTAVSQYIAMRLNYAIIYTEIIYNI